MKRFKIGWTLHGMIDIEAASEDKARDIVSGMSTNELEQDGMIDFNIDYADPIEEKGGKKK